MHDLVSQIRNIYEILRGEMKSNFDRHVSFGDLFTDRWDRAAFLGFGEGSSCYDSALILGDVKVRENTWIGPNTVLDGSGGLEIGSFCSISAGVQIYSHDSVAWSVSKGKEPKVYEKTTIGDGVYIGPQSVIQKGITIGDGAIIGAMSFVTRDVSRGAKVFGVPAKTNN